MQFQFSNYTTEIVIAALAVGAIVVVIAVWAMMIARRLERSWRLVDGHWRTVRARLKDRGDMLPRLASITRHRLTTQKEAMEVLGRLRTRSVSGRNPPEKAAAEAKLEAVLDRVLTAAGADPGLSGVSEFESLRSSIEDISAQVRHAVLVYNDAVGRYNEITARFPANIVSRRTGAEKVEYFDDGEGTFTAIADGQDSA